MRKVFTTSNVPAEEKFIQFHTHTHTKETMIAWYRKDKNDNSSETKLKESSNLICCCCCCSIPLSCLARWDPVDCSTPGSSAPHYLREVSTESAMLSNHLILGGPLLLSQNQGLFQWVSSSHQVAKVLDLQLQHGSFQWIFRIDFL